MFNYNPQASKDKIGMQFRHKLRESIISYVFEPAQENARKLLKPLITKQVEQYTGTAPAFRFMGRTFDAEYTVDGAENLYRRGRTVVRPISIYLQAEFEPLYHFLLLLEQEYNRVQIYMINMLQRCNTFADVKFLVPEPIQQNWDEICQSQESTDDAVTITAELKESLNQKYHEEIALVYKHLFSRFLY